MTATRRVVTTDTVETCREELEYLRLLLSVRELEADRMGLMAEACALSARVAAIDCALSELSV
jgi:hypothetical protein